MNLETLKDILDSDFPAFVKEKLILSEIARDKKSIPIILGMLNEERERKNDLISDLNSQFSRSLAMIKNPKLAKDKSFVFAQAKELFDSHDEIGCTFANVV